ncbi:MAG TPA: lysylphosphatidylglycerol synthase transmembrane domain-containing protein [Steroidobacteraceae bacterium]|nr:lysylphosphatidylglycerol synthase transmembrane domain-containing protein [Steroidobacteraceae bacterium]
MKNWLRVSITVLACALLLIYVVDVRDVWRTLTRCDPLWALVALGVFTLDRVLMSYKWGLLLAIRGYRVTLTERLMVYCSSMMWGLALPSTVGADGIRIVLVRRFGVRVDDALATILVERGLGFVSALLMAVMSLLVLRFVVPDAGAYDAPIIISIASLLTAIAVLLLSFNSRAATAVLNLLPRRAAQSAAARLITRLHEAYRSLASDRRRLTLFFVLTIAEQLLMAICYGLVALALQLHFNAIFLFAAVPLAILISRLPISIDGLGVYEGIFIGIMTLSGMRPDDSLALSLAARVFQIVVWLPWWLLLVARTGAMRPPAEPPAEPVLPVVGEAPRTRPVTQSRGHGVT